jgi:hypothetical protein
MMVLFIFRDDLLARSTLRTGTCRNDPDGTLTLLCPGFVHTMKSASKFDDQESLPVPDNHILAIIKNPDEAKVIVETLNGSGFAPDDIGLLTGEADGEKLDAVTGRKGFFAKMLASGVDMGDRDTEYFKQYRRALLEGHTVIGVEAKTTRRATRQDKF